MKGTYAMEDTDSMAIVATENGGIVPCPGGPLKSKDGDEAVKALSWKQVAKITERFRSLNPYDRDAVPGSVLKIESDNFDPETKKQRQIYCLAISAKRYVLFQKNQKGEPVLLREGENNEKDHWSKHGLGHVLNPTDPDDEDRLWISQAWRNIVLKSLNLKPKTLKIEKKLAVGRVSVSSPNVMKTFKVLNRGKKYADQIKPFNFLLTSYVRPFGHPPNVDPSKFHLVAPYESDARKWTKLDWIDEHSGKNFKVATSGFHGNRNTARVKTIGDLLGEYEIHPEAKCADKSGNPCGQVTTGLLKRRRTKIDEIKFIGKESNSLENVESELVHDEKSVYTTYEDPQHDLWKAKVLPALKKAKLKVLVKQCEGRLRRSALIELRAGRSRPQPKNYELLVRILKGLGFLRLLGSY